MEKETERISKSLAIVERQIVELKDSGNKTALDILRKKEARLKEELKGTQMTTNALAKNLLAQRKNIKGLSKIEFNDLIRRLSKRPEYSFLKTMPKDQIKNDLQVTAKPVGWRFKGRGNYDKPTAKQIVAGKKSGRVYNERRPLRSDVSQVVKLKDGGNVDNWVNYDKNHLINTETGMIVLKQTNLKDIQPKDIKGYERLEEGGNISEKNYYIQNNIGKAKYTISYFDGKTLNSDGSPFYGIKIFKNKVAFMRGIRDLKEQGYKSKYKEGGNVDLFQDYNNIPKNVSLILEKNTTEFGDEFGAMDFEDIKKMQKEVEAKGYTFDYDMDGSIYGLRPINVPLNQIEGYEDEYKDGGNIKNKKTILDLQIEEIAQLTNTNPIAIKKFLEQNSLTEKQIMAITIGLGRKQIKPFDFLNAIVGGKSYEKAIIKFAKSNEAFKNPEMSIQERVNRDVKLYIELNMKAEGSFSANVRMAQLVIASLSDANFHDRAYEFAKLIDPKLSSKEQFYKSDLMNPSPSDFEIATHIAELSDYEFVAIVEAYEYFLKDKNFIKESIALKQLLNPKSSSSKGLNKTSNLLKDASYISNRDIVSLTIKKGSDTIKINGNDILDGVYLKNSTTMSVPKESASDIVLKIITKAKELDKKVPFWGNLKEKMTIVTASRVQKLLDAGYDTKEIMLIYLGINSVYDVNIDNEFSYNAISGLFDYEISYIEEAIEDYVELANLNQYELGLKYPELDWSKIIEKYKISKTPKNAFEKKSTRGNEEVRYVYATYQGDDVVVSTSVDRQRWISGKKQPKDSYYSKTPITDGNFKNGYWGITSSKKEVIMDILSMIVSQSTNFYVKDIAVFRNNLGGAHAETLIENKIKFEQGGNIGRTISFMDWKGNVRKGVITEKLKRGYEVLTSDGVALVEDSEIIE